jgi:hypothetical protein
MDYRFGSLKFSDRIVNSIVAIFTIFKKCFFILSWTDPLVLGVES